MKCSYPKIVSLLGTLCDAWLVGSTITEDDPKDYDLFVPISKWKYTVQLLPKEVTLNTYGGFKFQDNDKTIDMWTDEFETLFMSQYFKQALHLKSGKLIISGGNLEK